MHSHGFAETLPLVPGLAALFRRLKQASRSVPQKAVLPP